MGFNLGKTLRKAGKALQKAGPLASLVPGASYIQTAAALAPRSKPRAPSVTPMASFGGVAPASYGGGAVPDWQPYPDRGGGGPGGGMTPTMGSLPSVLQTARRVNWGKIWNAVRVLGITAVATALNMEVGQLAAELMKHPKKHRRRGVTARQLNNARRVNRIVCGWAKQLQSTSPVRRRHCK